MKPNELPCRCKKKREKTTWSDYGYSLYSNLLKNRKITVSSIWKVGVANGNWRIAYSRHSFQDCKVPRESLILIAGENDAYIEVGQGKLTQQRTVGSKLVILPNGHATVTELLGKFN